MTVEMPEWLRSENVYPIKDDGYERPKCFLLAVKDSADDSEKKEFEENMNRLFQSISKILYPEMKNPRYLWNGKVVDDDGPRMDEKGHWVTTEENHKVHINEEGVPDKGNPFVVDKMKDSVHSTKEKMSPSNLKEIMSDYEGEGYAKAKERAEDNDREQFRFFANYMHGVGYGYDSHDAFYSYNYHGDTLINGMLRGGMPRSMKQQNEWHTQQKLTKQYVDQMTEAINENPLRQPAVVYRGIRTKSSLIKNLGLQVPDGVDIESVFDNKDFLESLVGRTFSDKGFVSTAIDSDVLGKGGFDKTCRMEIYCPKGTKGAYFGDALRFTDEDEFLLQRGTQFAITDAGYEDKPYGGGKVLTLKVAVVGQEPQEIPELKKMYEPNEKIQKALDDEQEISKTELRDMYPNISEGALNDVVELREKYGNEAFDMIYDILSEEAFVGNISPYEAGELEAYTCDINDIGGRIDSHLSQYGKKLDEAHPEYTPSKEIIDGVRKDYPDIPEKLVERIATMRRITQEHIERADREEKRGRRDFITEHIRKAAESYKRSEQYAIRAYESSKGRKS